MNRDQSLRVLEQRREALNNDLLSINKEVQEAIFKRDDELGKKNVQVSLNT